MEFWRFSDGTGLGEPLTGTYSIGLVVLSVAIAILAASCSLAVVDRVAASRTGRTRALWRAAGAIAMGVGIWAMHFTGMLSFRLPVAMSFDVGLTLLSIVPGVLGAGVGLHVMSGERVGWGRLQVGALLLAVGIGTMHYTGMEAMVMDADMRYRPGLFVLSIVVAHGLATVALWTRFALHAPKRVALWTRLGSAAILGGAVAGMHYTAMTSARFYAVSAPSGMQMGISHFVLGLSLCGAVALILGLTWIGTVVDARLSETAEELRQSIHRHAAVVGAMADGLIVTDERGTIRTYNRAAEEMFGYSCAEALGRDVRMLMPDRDRPTHQKGLAARRASRADPSRREGFVRRREVSGLRRDGTEFPLEIVISEVELEGEYVYCGVVRDLSERRALESQLRQAQKLESIGQLAAGIAHEINTPAQYVGDNTRFLQESFGELLPILRRLDEVVHAQDDGAGPAGSLGGMSDALRRADVEYLIEEIPRSIDQSLEGVARVNRIVRAMKEFSHPGGDGLQPLALNQAIESTVTVATNEWKYVAEVTTDLDPDLPPVPALAGELNQVVLNLIVNAAHAIADVVGDGSAGKGRIVVSTCREEGFALLRISDTGSGIAPEIRDRIFDPFFTTKEVGKGSGQGLHIAHTVIVQKHGGTIEVESEVGKGTTFTIRLPLQVRKASGDPRHREATVELKSELGEQGA